MEEEFYEKERDRFLYFAGGIRLLHGNGQHLSAKLWALGGIAINAGIVFYWITFPITDALRFTAENKPLSLFGSVLELRF